MVEMIVICEGYEFNEVEVQSGRNDCVESQEAQMDTL